MEGAEGEKPNEQDLIEFFNRNYDRLKTLVDQGKGLPEIVNVEIYKEGTVNYNAMADLLGAQEALDISNVKKGDLVWWKTSEGGTCYFVQGQQGLGQLRYVNAKGKIQDFSPVKITGASFGGSIRPAAILKNVPVEMWMPAERDFRRVKDPSSISVEETAKYLPRRLRSNVVESMGMVKASDARLK
jgi:hypothetical protein